MRQFDCPQCSAPIPFETPGAVFAVCPNCRSMVVRRDISLESIGTMAELPPDSSPLQIGAVGHFEGRRFRLLGRMRLSWKDGTWTEWYADFGDNRHGWIAESQGIFLISEAAPAPQGLIQQAAHPSPGDAFQIGGATYRVSDIKEVEVLGGEGELPFVAAPGETWRGIDLSAQGRQFAGLELQADACRLYLGKSALPEEVQWEGLRAVPGWRGEPVPITRNQSDALNCDACGGVIERRLSGESSTLVCSHCGTLLDLKGQKSLIAQKIPAEQRLMHPPIRLGTRGTLRGVEWEALGCQEIDDGWGGWSEILLHNPWHGFAWLTVCNGHWNWVRTLLDAPADTDYPTVDGVTYEPFFSGEVKVARLAGEFYWRVRVGQISQAVDYIAPPRILSRETYPDLEETTWSIGEYLPAEEVEKAFSLKFSVPAQGIFLNQPNPWAKHWPALRKPALYALLIAIVLEFLFGIFSSTRTVLEQTFEFKRPTEAGAVIQPIVSAPFEIKGFTKPAEILIAAHVQNSWIGMDVDLVNEQTGKIYPAEVLVEFYEGYDDGYWSEGKRNRSTYLPAVPSGRYHLAITPEADASITQMPFSVKVQHGGLFWSNFFLCAIAISLWPAWAWFRHYQFETSRWNESNL